MNRTPKAFWLTPGLIVICLVLAAILAVSVNLDTNPDPIGERPNPGISFGLTAEAAQALQQGSAFPKADAGFSAYYRVQDASDNFALDKAAIDQALLTAPTSSSFSVRAAPALLTSIGDNYSVVSLPVHNIDQTTTTVQVYYDADGWVVAYFPRGDEPSRAWQAIELDWEDPRLETLTRTTLLDAVNAVVGEALDQPAIATGDLGFYHWGFPTANAFFMIANARGKTGQDSLSFAVPAGFTVHDVSVSLWVSDTQGACASVSLDGTEIIGSRCDRQFQHAFVSPQDFNAPSGHTMVSTHVSAEDYGASGAMIMLIYTVPTPGQ